LNIQTVLITGFLGAGKTTLLERILEAYKNEKIGIIVNDFGSVNIDTMLVEDKAQGVPLVPLSGGSVFCACIKEDFVKALISMSREPIGYLFIEATGLADPGGMPGILESVASRGGDTLTYRGAVCVTDCTVFAELSDLLPVLKSQVKYSGAAIINKIDLAGGGDVTKIKEILSEINPGITIHITSFCNVDIKEIVNGLQPGADGVSSNTQASRPVTISLSGTKPMEPSGLRGFLDAVEPCAYRIKGFALTTEGGVKVSLSGNLIEIEPWPDVRDTRLFLVSKTGLGLYSAVSAAADEHCRGCLSV